MKEYWNPYISGEIPLIRFEENRVYADTTTTLWRKKEVVIAIY